MNIYLACTVRGDRCAVAVLRTLAARLEDAGHTILTRHLLDDDVDGAESVLGDREVFERDMNWLLAADVIVAEASGSSYGVGFEVGYVLGRADISRQRVLLLYDHERHGRVSRLISGNTHPACTTYPYCDAADLVRFVEVFLAPVSGC